MEGGAVVVESAGKTEDYRPILQSIPDSIHVNLILENGDFSGKYVSQEKLGEKSTLFKLR